MIDEQKQIFNDSKAILSALKAEIAAMGHKPLPHQLSTIESCERWLISREPFLGLNSGQQAYLDHFMNTIERI